MATMKNQADEMAAQLRHDCRVAAIKQAIKYISLFTAALMLLTWLVMRG